MLKPAKLNLKLANLRCLVTSGAAGWGSRATAQGIISVIRSGIGREPSPETIHTRSCIPCRRIACGPSTIPPPPGRRTACSESNRFGGRLRSVCLQSLHRLSSLASLLQHHRQLKAHSDGVLVWLSMRRAPQCPPDPAVILSTKKRLQLVQIQPATVSTCIWREERKQKINDTSS